MAKKAVFGSKRHGYNAMQKKKQRRATAMHKAGHLLGWFWHSGIFIVVAVAGFVYGFQQGEKNIFELNPLQGNILKNVEVSGNKMLTKEDLISLAALDSGKAMDSLFEDSIRNVLMQENWISEVHVQKKFPSKIILEVKESIPLMSAYEAGRWVVYSEKGKVLPLSMKTAYRLPVLLAAKKEERLLCGAFLKILLENDKSLFEKVSQISYSAEEKGIEVFFNNVSFKTLFSQDSVWNSRTFMDYRQMVDNFTVELSETNLLDMRFPGFAFVKKMEKRRKNG